MKSQLTILVLGCEPPLTVHVNSALQQSGIHKCELLELDGWQDDLYSVCPDLAIINEGIGKDNCISLIRKLKIVDPLMPVLILGDREDLAHVPYLSAFEGLHPISLPADPEMILEALEKAWKQKEESILTTEMPMMVGKSHKMKEIRKKIERVSDKNITVLITGETGTGKELIARSIHYFSHRNKSPLVKISCGNLPAELLESEVFGFQKGAFTDAHRNKPGRLELADSGTLFLDEVGDLPLLLQVKFLQLFEDKTFARLGTVDERTIDARVVAATNSDLAKKVREGEFRRDLFYRMNVVQIKTPSLRERKEDLPLLIEYFMNKYCSLLKRDVLDTPGEIMNLFMGYHWPGNVRELENMLRRAIVLGKWDFLTKEIHPGDSVPTSGCGPGSPDARPPVSEYFKNDASSLREITRSYVCEAERKAILDALDRTAWNKKKAAEMLGVSYKTVCNRVRDLGLEEAQS